MNAGTEDNTKRLLPAVFLISAAVIGWQLALMRCLLISRYQHFSFLVISCALLGFGAGGVLLALRRKWFELHYHSIFPWGILLFGILLPICFWLGEQFPLNVYFAPVAILPTIGWWCIFWLVHSIPFLSAGTLIGLALMAGGKDAHQIYASNLAGSAVGAIVGIGFLVVMPANTIVVPIALSVVLSSLFGMPMIALNYRRIFLFSVGICLVLFGAIMFTGSAGFFSLNVDQFKALSHVRRLEKQGDAQEIFRRDGPRGTIEVFSSPSFHTLLSLGSVAAPPHMDLILRDGFEIGSILSINSIDQAGFLQKTLAAMPYKLIRPKRVLILGETGGNYVWLARQSGAESIYVIQGDKNILEALERHKNHVLDDPRLRSIVREPRAFLDNATTTFDIIHLAALEGFSPGSGGIGGLREDYLATVEGFGRCLDLLTDSGVATVTRGIEDPARDNIKIAAMWIEALESKGVKDAGRHFLMARDELGFSTLVGKRPYQSDTVEKFSNACREMSWDTEWFPGIKPEWTNKTHVLAGPANTSISWYYHAMTQLLSSEREQFFREWIAYVRPATDDSPFFYDFFRLQSISKLRDAFGPVWPARAEMGFIVLLFSACLTLTVAALLLPGPIWLLRREEKSSPLIWIIFVIVFFFALGTGFMFIEMSFIQMFTRFMGDPVLAAALVLGALLSFAGVGSIGSSFFSKKLGRGSLTGPFLVSLGIIIYMELLPRLFEAAAWLPSMAKTGLGLVCLAPLACLMGIPFPLGIRALQNRIPAAMPLAWAVNGFASVISASGAVLLAMTIGFRSLLILAASAYFIAGGITLVLGRIHHAMEVSSENEA